MAVSLDELNSKFDFVIEALEEMQKNQKQTAEALSMLTEELAKLQKIVEETVK